MGRIIKYNWKRGSFARRQNSGCAGGPEPKQQSAPHWSIATWLAPWSWRQTPRYSAQDRNTPPHAWNSSHALSVILVFDAYFNVAFDHHEDKDQDLLSHSSRRWRWYYSHILEIILIIYFVVIFVLLGFAKLQRNLKRLTHRAGRAKSISLH